MSDSLSKKERRDLAKQARMEAERRARRAAVRRRILSTLVMIGIAAGIAGLFLWQSQKKNQLVSSIDRLAGELGCGEVQTFDAAGGEAQHVPEGEITYERMPPEAGDHRPAWANTGVFREPIETELTTHNLEHGQVLIHYKGTVSDAIRTQFEDVARSNPQWVIVSPYDEFNQGQVVSMTSWEVRLDCPKTRPPDADKWGELARAFVAAHQNNAPESVPGQPNDAEDEGDGGSNEETSEEPSEEPSEDPSGEPSEELTEPTEDTSPDATES